VYHIIVPDKEGITQDVNIQSSTDSSTKRSSICGSIVHILL